MRCSVRQSLNTQLNTPDDYLTTIYGLIRDAFVKGGANAPIFVTELVKQVTNRGYTQDQFYETVTHYIDLQVFGWTDHTKKALKISINQ